MQPLLQVLIVFIIAAVVTLATTPLAIELAPHIAAMDYPSKRRVNLTVIPRCGGIAIYLGFLVGVASFFIAEHYLGWTIINLYVIRDVNYYLLFFGITFVFCVGLVDDITKLKPMHKLAGQIVAALIVALSGVTISAVRVPIDGSYLMLAWADIPLTVLYLIAFVNVVNLIDGLDGLAAGIVAIVATALAYLCLGRGSMTLVLACTALVGACVAFLRYNFYPAKIFMGDSGSLLLGMLLGCISIMGVVRTQSIVVFMVPVIIAGVPVLDTLSAIIRRRRADVPVDEGDLGHIHHRLLNAGLGQVRSVGVLWLATAAMSVAGCVVGKFSGLIRWIFVIGLAVLLSLIIWKYGLFKPVLSHYYENKGTSGPRKPK